MIVPYHECQHRESHYLYNCTTLPYIIQYILRQWKWFQTHYLLLPPSIIDFLHVALLIFWSSEEASWSNYSTQPGTSWCLQWNLRGFLVLELNIQFLLFTGKTQVHRFQGCQMLSHHNWPFHDSPLPTILPPFWISQISGFTNPPSHHKNLQKYYVPASTSFKQSMETLSSGRIHKIRFLRGKLSLSFFDLIAIVAFIFMMEIARNCAVSVPNLKMSDRPLSTPQTS